ncbi:MAG: helix-turn-helix transcriptional regulator [Pseudomonadota bacterium]
MASALKKQRLARGLTQSELARLVGTSQAQIFRLENAERKLTVEWAERLAPALSASVETLLFGDGRPRSSATPNAKTIPAEAHRVFVQSLSFIEDLEEASGLDLSCEERAAYIVKFYNIFVETGQLPHELDSLKMASIASTVHQIVPTVLAGEHSMAAE